MRRVKVLPQVKQTSDKTEDFKSLAPGFELSRGEGAVMSTSDNVSTSLKSCSGEMLTEDMDSTSSKSCSGVMLTGDKVSTSSKTRSGASFT